MSKLISEADKLLEKGKIPEALEKLKAAQQAEPLNQLVATKLAGAYVENGETDKAVKVFSSLASRLSEAGKSQVAIAIYKQALDLAPGDIELKVKFATECEIAGKLSDAQVQANIALKHYLARKKYFDAANLMPLLVRIQGKDDRLKDTWIDILQLSQAEKKLIHLLVALCGPPGLVSEEFSVGGDPVNLSPKIYEKMKQIVPYFPRDPKIAYAVAWAAQRRGLMKEFYFFLRECLRRDPDFCLALLLLARALAEQQKLNESLYVYKHMKERLMADKSVDMNTLNRLIEGFVEKNGWISFNEGDPVDTPTFLATFQAAPAVAPAAAVVPPVPPVPAAVPPPSAPIAPVIAAPPPVPSTPTTPPPVPSTVPTAPVDILASATPEDDSLLEKGSPTSVSMEIPSAGADIELGLPPAAEMEVQHTGDQDKQTAAPEAAIQFTVPTTAEPPKPAPPAGKITFNPFESDAPASVVADKPPLESGEKTAMFSPFEVLSASGQKQGLGAEVKTQTVLERPEDLAGLSSVPNPLLANEAPAAPSPAPENRVAEAPVEGEKTQLFSPFEAIEAGPASRRPHTSAPPVESPDAQEATVILSTLGSAPPEDGTMVIASPMVTAAPETPPATSPPPAPIPEEIAPEPAAMSAPEIPAQGAQFQISPPPELVGKIGGAFMPIPGMEPSSDSAEELSAGDNGEKIDLGDDLLNDPTRILVVKPSLEPTSNLVRELKKDIAAKGGAVDPEFLLRKSERYIAKRNYYMARKILRHALAVGGNEEKIKDRLRDIRKLELPNSLYSAMSTDSAEKKERSQEILDRLEEEFDLRQDEKESDELVANIDLQLENIFRETDPRTILDFGVALHEMGLFRQAEGVFSRLVDEFPDFSFDAYYLAAVSKHARKDYAGAVSILKKLSADGDRSEIEKIQVYYALGETFEKMERPESSQEFYRKVAELDANYRNVKQKLEE